MRIISSDEIDACLQDRDVLETLRKAFRSNTVTLRLTDLEIGRPDQLSGLLSFQPAWTDFAAQRDVTRGYIGCAISLDLPGQPGPSSSLYLLFSGSAGQPIALLDGMRLNVWRSAGGACPCRELSLARGHRPAPGDRRRSPPAPARFCLYRRAQADVHIARRNLGGNAETDRRPAVAEKNVHVGTTAAIHEAQEGADIICIAGPESGSGTYHALTYLDPPAGCHIDVLDPAATLPTDLLEEARLFSTDLSVPPGRSWSGPPT
ncbi:ornithine cyclodeaminase [Roseibium salinum]|nr:ornithine cyclodeaminase [Roseibium salinum]